MLLLKGDNQNYYHFIVPQQNHVTNYQIHFSVSLHFFDMATCQKTNFFRSWRLRYIVQQNKQELHSQLLLCLDVFVHIGDVIKAGCKAYLLQQDVVCESINHMDA